MSFTRSIFRTVRRKSGCREEREAAERAAGAEADQAGEREDMSDDELAEKLRDVERDNRGDIEAIGDHAEMLLIEVLRSLGYNESMDVYESFVRWGA